MSCLTSNLHKVLVSIMAAALVISSTPIAAWASLEEDQTPASEEEIQQAIQSGEVGAPDSEADSQGDSAPAMARAASFARAFSGDTRFDTAVMQAKAAYSSSKYLIVVGDGAWPDALAADGLAGLLDCPILLTSKGSLSAQTAQAVKDLGVSNVVVLGGPLVISDNVVSGLSALGVQVTRLAGETRQDTQMEVYNYGKTAPNGQTWSTDTVAFASGTRFHDALSFSPYSFKNRVPVFLLDGAGNLKDSQKQALSGSKYVTSVVLGGPIVTSNDTVSFASSISSSGACTRLAGDTRYDTSAQVASWCVGRGFTWSGAAFTTADLPYDALAGGVLQGKEGSVILLVSGTSSSTVSAAATHTSQIKSIKFFGGKLSISNNTRMGIMHALGRRYAEIPGYKVYIDAGHGYNDSNNGVFDPGAVGSGYREADLTKELADMVGSILKSKWGIDCYVNDDGGWYKLRQADAEARGCMSLVSIHFNSGGGTGSESLRHSYNAAENAYNLQKFVHPYLIDGVRLADRGMKRQEVAILGGRIPATLLEICFIDNSSDMRQYQSRKQVIATRIADGIALAG